MWILLEKDEIYGSMVAITPKGERISLSQITKEMTYEVYHTVVTQERTQRQKNQNNKNSEKHIEIVDLVDFLAKLSPSITLSAINKIAFKQQAK